MENKSSTISLRLFNSQLTTIISISMVLFILGITTLITCMARDLSVYVKENLGFTIFLNQDIKESQVQSLRNNLVKYKEIKSIEYITKEKALDVLIDELGEDPNDFLGYNPLMPSIEVHLHSDYTDRQSYSRLEQKIKQYAGVNEIIYRKDLINLVNENIHKVGSILLLLILILLFISYSLINNTIRLTIYSKRFLIYTMKLVGASQSFIRRPFIIRNIINGIIASCIAISMLMIMLFYISGQMHQFINIMYLDTLWIVFTVMVIAGIIITSLSAYYAVTKYLNMSQDQLYYI